MNTKDRIKKIAIVLFIVAIILTNVFVVIPNIIWRLLYWDAHISDKGKRMECRGVWRWQKKK